MTPEQEAAIAEVRAFLKEGLSNISREATDAESAARKIYFCLGPRISIGECSFDPVRELALEAMWRPSAFDAAKAVAAELLERDGTLPEEMACFVAKVLRGEVSRPPHTAKRNASDLRNKELAFAVWKLEMAGIRPTKAVESEKLSGCDIVADIYDELLANDADGCIAKTKGGEFTHATMRDIWLKNPQVKELRGWINRLPD